MRRGQSLALVFVLSCGSPSSPAAPTVTTLPPPAGEPKPELCGKFDVASVQNGEYKIQNNEWNSDSVQCLEVGPGPSFRVSKANQNIIVAGPPASYPSIFKGCHWGNCTQNSGLPIQVSKLQSAISEWSTIQLDSGAYNVAYDVWYNTTSTTTGNPDGAELMIWIGKRGVLPAGSRIATITIGEAKWEVWTTRMPDWNYIAYVRDINVSSVINLDIGAFTKDAVDRGLIRNSWFLIDVEAGFEIWQGGAGLATNSFSFTASAF